MQDLSVPPPSTPLSRWIAPEPRLAVIAGTWSSRLTSSPSCSSCLGASCGGYLAVEGGKFGFQRLSAHPPCPTAWRRWLRAAGTSAFRSLAVRSSYWAYDAGESLQSVDAVHAGGLCVAHGDEAVVVLGTCSRPRRQSGSGCLLLPSADRPLR